MHHTHAHTLCANYSTDRLAGRRQLTSRYSATQGGQWKTNTGTSTIEEIPVTDAYRRWADLCAASYGGLDIVTVDALHMCVSRREADQSICVRDECDIGGSSTNCLFAVAGTTREL